jgi:photosystem II stability/assembly factor-like uncharacterized protein
MAIGAIALSPTTGWVYAGTGEANTNGDGLSGTGVYRTKDDGQTWERVAANLDEASTVFHVAVSRAEGATADSVFVATNSGLFASFDGGDSYTDVALPTNEDATAPYTLTRFGNYVTDVRVQPGAPDGRHGRRRLAPRQGARQRRQPRQRRQRALPLHRGRRAGSWDAHGHQPRRAAVRAGPVRRPAGPHQPGLRRG